MPVIDVHSDGYYGIDISSCDLSWLTYGEEECRSDDDIWGKVHTRWANTIGEDKASQGLESNDVELSIFDKIFHQYYINFISKWMFCCFFIRSYH